MAESVSEISNSHFDLRSTEISEVGIEHMFKVKSLVDNLKKAPFFLM